MRLLVYGTLKRHYNNNRFLHNASFIREDRVRGFKLKDSGFPAAMPDEGAMITGEVWDIGDPTKDRIAADTLAGCDMLEGYDHRSKDNYFYVRKEVLTESGEQVSMYVGCPESFEGRPDWPCTEEHEMRVYSWGR